MAIFKVSIKLFDGIGVLKKVLKAGVDASTEKGYDVKITILGAPDYLAEVSTATKEEGEEAIMCALNRIESYSKEMDADREYEIKTKPKVVGDSTARIHEIYAEAMENENAKDSDEEMGDDDDD